MPRSESETIRDWIENGVPKGGPPTNIGGVPLETFMEDAAIAAGRKQAPPGYQPTPIPEFEEFDYKTRPDLAQALSRRDPSVRDKSLVQTQPDQAALTRGEIMPSLFRPEAEIMRSLFTKPVAQIVDNRAANVAHAEVLLGGGRPGDFDSVMAVNKDRLVLDEALSRMVELDTTAVAEDIIQREDLTLDQKAKAVRHLVQRTDLRGLDPYTTLLFTYIIQEENGGMVPLHNFEETYKETPVAAIEQARNRLIEQQVYRAQVDVDELAAAQDFGTYGDMFQEVAVQDFIPVWNVLTRIGFNRKLLEASGAGIEQGFRGFMHGEARQIIRDYLVSLTPEDRADSIADMRRMVESLQRDETYGPFLTTYNVVESWQAIMTEEVLVGASSENTIDRFIGGFELAIESLLSVMAVAKLGGRGLRGGFRAGDASRARQIARVGRNPRLLRELDAALQQDTLAAKFQVSPDTVAVSSLPRPTQFADDLDAIPNGEKLRPIVEETERVRLEIGELAGKVTGDGLTLDDKANAVRKIIHDLDMNDGMEIQSGMSTIKMLDDEQGVEVVATIGQAADKGWHDFEELIEEILDLDPFLDSIEIMRTNANGVLEPAFISRDDFLRAVYKKEYTPSMAGSILGAEEFYIRYTVQKFWHPLDKQAFNPGSLANAATWLGKAAKFVFNPNRRFSDDIAGAFNRAHMNEQALSRTFETMFQPYYNLTDYDKRQVQRVLDWNEESAKAKGRAPTMAETFSHFGDLTTKQWAGLVSLRTGTDTMYEMFNRRLYRDFLDNGFKTAKPLDSALPTFHGKMLGLGEVKAGTYYDPSTGKMRRFSQKEVDDAVTHGSGFVKLDIAIDGQAGAKNAADQVWLDKDVYKIGELGPRPLDYHPGWSPRFYDDTYYIIKETKGAYLNGKFQGSRVLSQAIRTAPSTAEALHWAKRAQYRETLRYGEKASTFKVVRMADISQEEGALYQKQVLNREGRLFWDKRNFDRLPDVHGNPAKLEDPVISLERAIALASRQHTHEDLMRGQKQAWEKRYGYLLQNPKISSYKSLKHLVEELDRNLINTVDPKIKKELVEARELIQYYRLMQGTESFVVPKMRAMLIGGLGALQRSLGTEGRTLKWGERFRSAEKFAEQFDPLRQARSLAFKAFMVTRPARQLVMQSLQFSFLAGLKPTYVASPQFFRDGINLRNGAIKLIDSSFDDGVSVKRAAQAMRLSQAEYRRLVKEFSRSGLMDTVDVHSFTGARRSGRQSRIPETKLGAVGKVLKRPVIAVHDRMKAYGFDLGEQMNLSFTYNLAVRRYMEKNKLGSLLDIGRAEWDQIRMDASNLALAMTKPNQFGYQAGSLSLATQFLSFSHKAMLAVLGQNPAIKGMDVARIAGFSYLLWGANMFGGRDFVEEHIRAMGGETWMTKEIPGLGYDVVDLISGGIIEANFNALFGAMTTEWKELNLGFLAPGFDVNRFIEMNVQTILEDPVTGFFGPFGNLASKVQKALNFAAQMVQEDNLIAPGTKATIAMDLVARSAIPGYNDAMTAWVGYQTGRWISTEGNSLPLETTWNGLVAKGAFGANTTEVLTYYRLRNQIWESDTAVDEIVMANRKHFTKLISLYGDRQMSEQDLIMQMSAIMSFFEEFPEGRRMEIVQRSLVEGLDENTPSVVQQYITALGDGKLDKQAIQMIRNIEGIPPALAEELIKMAEEAWEERVITEKYPDVLVR